MNNWFYILFVCILLILIPIVIYLVERSKYIKKYNKKDFMFSCDVSEAGSYAIFVCVIIGAILTLCFSIVILCSTVEAKTETETYKEKYSYVMEVINEQSDLSNVGVTQTILEYNNWLAKTRAGKKALGNWSFYKNIDLDSLNYIGIEGQKNE